MPAVTRPSSAPPPSFAPVGGTQQRSSAPPPSFTPVDRSAPPASFAPVEPLAYEPLKTQRYETEWESETGAAKLPPPTQFDVEDLQRSTQQIQRDTAGIAGRPVGTAEAITGIADPQRILRMAPFVGSIMEAGGVDFSAPRPRPAPTGDPEFDASAEQKWLAEMQQREVQQARPRTTGASAANIVETSLPFAAEFAMTGGTGGAGKTLLQQGVKAAFKRATVQTARSMPFFAPRIAANTRERMQNQFTYQQGEDGLLHEAIVQRGDDLLPAITKATADVTIEVFSERSGEVLGAFGSKLTQLPGIRIAAEKLNDFKAALVGKLMDATGLQLPAFVNHLREVGYHGIIAEVGEELVGDALRGALEAAAPGYGEPFALPSGQQLAAEVTAFAIPGLANLGINSLGARRGMPGTVERPIVIDLPVVPMAPAPVSAVPAEVSAPAAEPPMPGMVPADQPIGTGEIAQPFGPPPPSMGEPTAAMPPQAPSTPAPLDAPATTSLPSQGALAPAGQEMPSPVAPAPFPQESPIAPPSLPQRSPVAPAAEAPPSFVPVEEPTQEVTDARSITPPDFNPVSTAVAYQQPVEQPAEGGAVDSGTGEQGGAVKPRYPTREPRDAFPEIVDLLAEPSWTKEQQQQARGIIKRYQEGWVEVERVQGATGKTGAAVNQFTPIERHPDIEELYRRDTELVTRELRAEDESYRSRARAVTSPALPGVTVYVDPQVTKSHKGKLDLGKEQLTAEQILEKMQRLGSMKAPQPKLVTSPTYPKKLPSAPKSIEDEIGALRPFTAKEPTRYAIPYVYVGSNEAVATDGRRLSIVTAEGPGGFAKYHKPDPAVDVEDLKKKLAAVEKRMEKYKGEHKGGNWDKIVKDYDGLRYQLNLAEGRLYAVGGTAAKVTFTDPGDVGQFPHWRDIIPKYSTTDAVEIDILETLRNVRKAAILTSDESKGVVVVLNPNGTLGFAARAPSIGHVEINTLEGNRVLGGANPGFFEEALEFVARAGAPTTKFSFPQFNRPMVFESGRYKHILMPVNVEGVGEGVPAYDAPPPPKPEPKEKAAAESTGGSTGSSEASKPVKDMPEFEPREGTAVGAAREVVRPLQSPELVKLARAITGHTPSVRKMRQAWGRFYPSTGAIKINPELGKNPVELASTLAHEIGHAVDWAPTKEMRRGNLLGRLFTLRKHLKNTFGATNVTNKEVRKELMDLSQWWRSWDPAKLSKIQRAYYGSAKELYADAVSVLLNSPGELETRAPKFYRTFFEALDRKPNVRDAYLNLQDLLNGVPAELQAARRADLREGFARGETVWRARQEEARASGMSIIAKAKQLFLDKAAPIIDAEKAAAKSGATIADSESAMYAMDELTHKDSVNHVFLEDVERTVWQPMREAGLTMDDAGEFMALRRMINERTEIINPFGHTPDTAKEAMADLERVLGAEKFAALQKHIQRFDDMVFKVAEEAVSVGAYNSDTFDNTILPNKGNYAAFAVVDYLEANMPAGIRQQVGTFKEIANPFVATTMKTVSLNRAIELNSAKNKVRDMLKRYHPDEIKKKPHAPGGQPRKAEPGNDHLVVMENGFPAFYEVDKYIARAFERNDIGILAEISQAISAITYKPFHALYVTASPGFAVFNIQRDLKRTYKNLSAVKEHHDKPPTFREVLKAYWDAAPQAWRRARRQFDPLIREMMEQKVLDIPFASYEFTDADTNHDRMLKRYGLGPDVAGRSGITRLLADIFHGIESFSVFTESLAKVATYKMLRDRGVSPEYRNYVVRNYVGTPNYKTKGLATELTNGLFMYSKVVMQGWRADARIATRPKTAAGYWMRGMAIDFLPKIAQAGAKAGLFGAAVAAVFALIPDYDLKKYICIPLGMTRNEKSGEMKAVYLRFPHDDVNRALAAMLWDGLTGKYTGMAEEVYGELPGISPPIEMAHNWVQFAAGRNPYDAFRGRDVISRDAWEAGGWYAGEEMVRWTLDQFGVASTIMHGFIGKPGEPARETTVEKVIGSVPGLSRILKISNRGMYEDAWSEVREEEAEGARRRLKLDDLTRNLLRERYRLTRLGEERLNLRDLVRRALLNEHYKVYLDITKGIKAAEERGDKDEAKRLRQVIADVSKRMSEAMDRAGKEASE